MGLSDWLSITAIVLSFVALVLTSWLEARMSASQIDDNIMNSVNSVLGLLDKVRTLNTRERELLVQLLRDWDYFTPPKFIQKRRGPKPSDATIRALKQYFDDVSRLENPNGPDNEAV